MNTGYRNLFQNQNSQQNTNTKSTQEKKNTFKQILNRLWSLDKKQSINYNEQIKNGLKILSSEPMKTILNQFQEFVNLIKIFLDILNKISMDKHTLRNLGINYQNFIVIKNYFEGEYLNNDELLLKGTWQVYIKIIKHFANLSQQIAQKDQYSAKSQYDQNTKVLFIFKQVTKIIYKIMVDIKNHNITRNTIQETCIHFVDQALLSNHLHAFHQIVYEEFNINLLTVTLPLRQFSKNPESRQKKHSHQLLKRIKQNIQKTKSIQLKPLRYLLCNDNSNNNDLKVERQKEEKWVRIMREGGCMINNMVWNDWVGIFIQYNLNLIINNQQILKVVLRMCKQIAERQFSQFYSHQPQFHIGQIIKLIKEVIKRNQSLSEVLPVITKLLGESGNPKIIQLNTMLDMQCEENILKNKLIGPIERQILFHQTNQRQQEYQQPHKPFFIQKHIKFLTKMICISPESIELIEYLIQPIQNRQEVRQSIMSRKSQQIGDNIGLNLILFLLQCLAHLDSEEIETIKCIRYIVRAIDTLFCCKFLRKKLLSTICAHSVSSTVRINFIRINDLFLANRGGEFGRQCAKLRQVIAIHVHNVLAATQTITSLFPYRLNKQSQQKYKCLYQFILKKQTTRQMQLLQQTTQYLSITWFYELFTLVFSTPLTAMDFNTVKLLLQKMRVNMVQLEQFEVMEKIVELMNKTKIIDDIYGTLKCKIGNNQQQQNCLLYGLSNFCYSTLSSSSHNYISDKKVLKEKDLQRCQVIGKICGSLQIIQVSLKLHNERPYPLLTKLNFYQDIIHTLTNPNSIYHYTQQLNQSSIKTNMLFTISSYIAFKHQQSTIINTSIYYIQKTQILYENSLQLMDLDPNQDHEFQYQNIDPQVFTNLLNQPVHCHYQRTHTIASATLRLLSQYLNSSSNLYYKLVFNSNLAVFLENQNLQNARQHLKGLLRLLKSQDEIIKIQCYQLLTLSIGNAHHNYWFNLVIENLPQICMILRTSVNQLKKEQIILLSRIVVFILTLLRESHKTMESFQRPSNIMLAVLDKLFNYCRKNSHFQKQRNKNYYQHLQSQININLSTIYKATINASLQILLIMLPIQTQATSLQLISYLRTQANTILTIQPLFPSLNLINQLNISPNFQLSFSKTPNGTFISASQLSLNILSSTKYAYGRNYMYHTPTAYYEIMANEISSVKNKSKRDNNEYINQIYEINCLIGLSHANYLAIQSYCCVMQYILGVGKYGYILSNYEFDCQIPQDYTQVFKNKINKSGCGINMLGETPQIIWMNCKQIIQKIQQLLDCNTFTPFNKDSLYVVIAGLLYTLYSINHHPSIIYHQTNTSESNLIIRRTIELMPHQTLHFRTYLYLCNVLVYHPIQSNSVNPQYYKNATKIITNISNILKSPFISNPYSYSLEDIDRNIIFICSIISHTFNTSHYINYPITIQKQYLNSLIQFVEQITKYLNKTIKSQHPCYPVLLGTLSNISQLPSMPAKPFFNLVNNLISSQIRRPQIQAWQWHTLSRLSLIYPDWNDQLIGFIKKQIPRIKALFIEESISLVNIIKFKKICEFIITINSHHHWINNSYIPILQQVLSLLLNQNFITQSIKCPSITTLQRYLSSIFYQENMSQSNLNYKLSTYNDKYKSNSYNNNYKSNSNSYNYNYNNDKYKSKNYNNSDDVIRKYDKKYLYEFVWRSRLVETIKNVEYKIQFLFVTFTQRWRVMSNILKKYG